MTYQQIEGAARVGQNAGHGKVPAPSSGFSIADALHSANVGIACFLTYWIMVTVLSRLVDAASGLLGGMWAVIAAIFVMRETGERSWSAGLDRLVATCVSFALCLAYLWFFPFTPLGMSILIAAGVVVMTLLGRRDDIILTGITTTVVMVVVAIDPNEAWRQPFLRLVDTVVGITVGLTCKGIGSFLLDRTARMRRPG
jgi:uncharacterized membrane protein YgaE (UPF0421/DUF939 family)